MIALLLLGALAAAHAEYCTRWETFGAAGINSLADLTSNGWQDLNFHQVNDQRPEYRPSPNYITFRGGTKKELPSGGDFVRVRYGTAFAYNGGITDLFVGGQLVNTAAHSDGNDVTTDANYSDGDYVHINARAWVGNIWSVDVCNHVAPPEPELEGSCFHGDSTVLLESGSSKRLSELSLGESIKTSDGRGNFSFHPVLTLPHANNTEPAVFLTLTTETRKKVDMTSDHFIPKCDLEEVTAGELVVGDCLLTVDGKETLLEISSTAKNGVYTAITQEQFIVVDGIVASPFSKDSDPGKPELDYKKYRLELEQNNQRNPARMSKLKKRLHGLGSA
jgi:hypothetical protein